MTLAVHSRETFGTLDGPGVRYVLFLVGCPLRCRYCHNPDTWASEAREHLTVDAVLAEYKKNRAFYENGGGITVSGGEPLLQKDAVAALFSAAKREGIHTCLDTSGFPFDPERACGFDALLSVTDLVLLDLKHLDPNSHRALTGRSNEPPLAFARHLEEKGVKTRVRHVLVPGITDSEEHLAALARFVKPLKNLESLELLPYHSMARHKYAALGLDYPLPSTPDATEADIARAKSIIKTAWTS